MWALLGVWASLLASLLQFTYYACLLRAPRKHILGVLEKVKSDPEDPVLADQFPQLVQTLSYGVAGLGFGLLFGLCLSWPIANFVGRRKGLLLSNIFLLLALLSQWTGSPSNFSSRFILSNVCVGIHLSLQTGLQLLYIFETTRNSWRGVALVSIFLCGILVVTVALWADPIPKSSRSLEENWPDLLTIALIPAGVQVGALLCSVESPGWTAVQGGNRVQAVHDAEGLSLSASDVGELAQEVGDITRARCTGVVLVMISLLAIFSNGVIYKRHFLIEILEKSGPLWKYSSLISLCLTLLCIGSTWAGALWLSSRVSGTSLFFGSLAGIFLSATVRIFVMTFMTLVDAMLSGHGLAFLDRLWELTAWLIYLVDGLTIIPLVLFLSVSMFLLPMEQGGQRGRAQMISCPWLVLAGVSLPVFSIWGMASYLRGGDIGGQLMSFWDV